MDGFFSAPLSYAALIEKCESISRTCPGIRLTYIGNSLLSRRIPMLSLGDGEREVFYCAGHHGSEWLCSSVLLRFAAELGELAAAGRSVFGISLSYLCRIRRISILPMLNVDGTEISLYGAGDDCPTAERLQRANGSSDFTHWQANARGVDLNHNYNARFYEYKELERAEGMYSAAPSRWSGEYPESEPETACLCNYLRYRAPRLVLSLHSQGEVIYGDTGEVEGADAIASRLSAYTGYALDTPEGGASCGGLCDWYRAEMHLPAFTVECGRGENPLPLSDGEGIYSRLRRALFCAPAMV